MSDLIGKDPLDVLEERNVKFHLREAWNSFNKLSEQHPDDRDEFRLSLHRLQHLMGMRELRRTNPSEWPCMVIYRRTKEDLASMKEMESKSE